MCGLEEFEATVFYERNPPPGELDLQLVTVVTGTKQYRLAFQIDAGFAMLENALDHVIDLGRLIHRQDQLWTLARGCLRKELLPETLARLPDHRVAGVEDGLGRTIILLESDDARGRGELLWEIQNVPYRGR